MGEKFSSGVPPREIFYRPKAGEDEQYLKYYADYLQRLHRRSDGAHKARAMEEDFAAGNRQKERPKSEQSNAAAVVKTSLARQVQDRNAGTGTYTEGVDVGRPYASELVRSSPTFDISGRSAACCTDL